MPAKRRGGKRLSRPPPRLTRRDARGKARRAAPPTTARPAPQAQIAPKGIPFATRRGVGDSAMRERTLACVGTAVVVLCLIAVPLLAVWVARSHPEWLPFAAPTTRPAGRHAP